MSAISLLLISNVAAVAVPQAVPEVVIVTASPLRDSADALSQGVAVVSRLEAANGALSGGIGEALGNVPGVRSTFYGPNASRPIIRGLGEDRIRLIVNGLAGIDASTISPDHAPAVDGLDASQIEVLKGPAALRFGSNAIGGVINVVDGRLRDTLPDRPFLGEFFAGRSSAEGSNAGSLRLTATTGAFVFGIDGLARFSDDYEIPGFAQTSAKRAETGDDTRGAVPNSRGELWAAGANVAHITQRTNFALSARQTGSEYGIPFEEAFIDLKQTRMDGRAIVKDVAIFDDLTISATTGDYSHSEIEFDGEVGTVFKNNGYELRLEGRLKPFGPFDGLYGLQYGSSDFSALGEEAFILPVTIEQSGVFGFQRYRGEAKGAELGVRLEKRDYSGVAGQRSFDLTSGSASAYLEPIPGLRVSVSGGYTQRAPTEVELFADGPHAATAAYERGNANLKKEIATSLEGGLNWLHKGFSAQLSLWQAQFDGFVGFEPTGEIEDSLPVFEVVQQDGKLSGFELSLTAPIYAGNIWSLTGEVAMDYVRGQYDAGGNIARIPAPSLTAGLEARSKQWRVKGEAQSISDQDKVAAFETTTQGATVYNLDLGWKPIREQDRLELTLRVSNLTNEDVREHTSFLKDTLPKPGRSIKLSLRAQF